MREIKFRAYYKSTNELIYNVDITHEGKAKRLDPNCKGFCIQYDPFYEISDNIMQYTGLKDKNGKEIYEGDIIEADWLWLKPHVVQLPVDWWAIPEYGLQDNMTILGNIYETPHLIGVKND